MALYDTGANFTGMSKSKAENLKIKWQKKSGSAYMADGTAVQCLGRAKTSVTIGSENHETTIFVFDKLHHDIVVGTDTIEKFLLEQRVGLKIFQHNKPLTNMENKSSFQPLHGRDFLFK